MQCDERVQGPREDIDRIAAGVDGNDQTLGAVVIEHGPGRCVEGVETGLEGRRAIVASLQERSAAAVAETVDERAVECHVIGDSAVRTAATAGKALDRVSGRQFVADHGIERRLFFGQEAVESFGLGDRAREAVEHESPAAAEARAPLVNKGQQDIVADESTAVHTQLRVGSGGVTGEQSEAGGPEQFTCGEGARPERGFEQFGLRAFADAGRADQHQAPGVRHGGGGLAARGVSAENPRVAIACWGHVRTLTPARVGVGAYFVQSCADLAWEECSDFG